MHLASDYPHTIGDGVAQTQIPAPSTSTTNLMFSSRQTSHSSPERQPMNTDADLELGKGIMGGSRREGAESYSDAEPEPSQSQARSKEDEIETDYRPVNWKRLFFRPKYIPIWILTIAITVFTIYISIHHDQVVSKLTPITQKLRDVPAGWLVPIVVLVIISFPPLFGHELVALLCGIVYGLWIGFGIVAAGTFFGEVGTWFAFKYLFRRKAAHLERTNLTYGALARLAREGGFWIIFAIRFSVIPSHISTAVFSTCNVNFWYFAVATFLTLPKQLVLVYLGVIFISNEDNKNNLVSDIVFAITAVISLALGWWIWKKMKTIKRDLLAEQERRREERELTSVKRDDGSTLVGSEAGEGVLMANSNMDWDAQVNIGTAVDQPYDHQPYDHVQGQSYGQAQSQPYDNAQAHPRTNDIADEHRAPAAPAAWL